MINRLFLIVIIQLLLTCSIAAQESKNLYWSNEPGVHDSTGALVKNARVGIRTEYYPGIWDSTSIPMYVETHFPVTNHKGVVTITSGKGNVILGTFNPEKWKKTIFTVVSMTDPYGGTDYKLATIVTVYPESYLEEMSKKKRRKR